MKRADHERIQSVLDGTMTEIDFHRFQEDLRKDTALRKLYQSYALLHHSLAEEFHGQAMVGQPRSARPIQRARSGWMTGLLSAAAALAIVATAIWLAAKKPESEPALAEVPVPEVPVRIDFSPDAGWRVDGELTTREGRAATLPGTRLFLDKGVARFQFPNDVVGHLEAPAEIIYKSATRVVVEEGRGRFRVGPAGKGFTVSTSSLEAIDLGTEFAIVSHRSAPDELHVFEGKVEMRTPQGRERPLLTAGEAASVSSEGRVTRIAARPDDFANKLPELHVAFEDHFESSGGSLHGRLPQASKGPWEVRQGTAVLGSQSVVGGGFQAFCKLDGPAIGKEHPLLVATLELGPTVAGPMHGPGWAGLSLYAGDAEVVFFGDSFGDAETWSLDVKQGLDPILPEPKMDGPRIMTMVYDWRTGVTSLHSGDGPGAPEVVRGRIPARLSIDGIRIGASDDATINVRQVVVRLLDAAGQ
ncbi:MAG: FecR domain-containing protein [Verrucomicrobiales bacterium]